MFVYELGRQLRGDPVGPDYHAPLAHQSKEGRWRDAVRLGQRRGAFASFVAPDNILYLFSAEPRRESMGLEVPGFGSIISCALWDSQFPQSIRG